MTTRHQDSNLPVASQSRAKPAMLRAKMSRTASERITEEVTSWPGVEAGPGSRGEFSFTVGRREIGHLHGDHAAHFVFPKQTGLELKAEGRIVDHPVFPGKPGPGARRIEDDDDVADVIGLMRLNYDRVVARYGVGAGR